MSRRALLITVLLTVLHPRPAAADLDGSRRLARQNRKCANAARRRLRHGLTDRERATLERLGCREDAGLGWVSAWYFTAEGE